MRLIEYFDRIYIINLPERKDRFWQISRELKNVNMPLTPGKVEIFPAIHPRDAAGFPSPRIRGTFLSHVSIVKQAKKDGLRNVLVLEDDLCISKLFLSNEASVAEKLKTTNWGFIYLGHNVKCKFENPCHIEIYKEMIQTTHFYGVNGTIFDRLIAHMEEIQRRPPGHPDGGPMHYDGAAGWFQMKNPDVVTLITCPPLGWQGSSKSDLAPNKIVDKIPVVRQLVKLTRLLKNILIRK